MMTTKKEAAGEVELCKGQITLFDLQENNDVENSDTAWKDRYSSNPVITKVMRKSSKELIPYSEEELKGYHLPEQSGTVSIITGVVKDVTAKDGGLWLDITSVKKSDVTIRIDISESDNVYKKASMLCIGDRVSVIVSDGKCLRMLLGPFFGVASWNLFYGDNKKQATKFMLKG